MTHKNPLPANPEPIGDICIPVSIPDDNDWVLAFLGLMGDPLLARYWQQDDDLTALKVREVWDNRVYTPLVSALINNETCSASQQDVGSCFRVDTSHEIFEYYPNDPFNPDDSLGTSIGLQWIRIGNVTDTDIDWLQALVDAGLGLSGYFPNDVVLVPKIYNAFGLKRLDDFISSFTGGLFPFPTITIKLEGTGQLELELLNVPLGGSAFIFWDIEPTLAQLIDLVENGEAITNSLLLEVNRDVFSAPPELVVSQVQEIEFNEEGEHYVTVWFIPRIDDSIPFLFPFAGFREIEVCGNLEIIGSQTGTLYDKRNYGDTSGFRKGAIGTMTTQEVCDGVKCAVIDLMEATLLGLNSGNVRGGVNVTLNEAGEYEVQLSSSVRQAIDTAPQVLPQANLYGSAIAAQNGLQEAHDIITTGQVNGVAQDDVVSILTFSFHIDATDAATAVASIYADLVAVDPVFDDFTGFADLAYCEGLTVFSLSNFIFSNAATAELASAIDFMRMFEPQQFAVWREAGLTKPKEGYQGTPCYQIPAQFFTLDADSIQSGGNGDVFNGVAGTKAIFNIFPDSPVRTSTWSYLLYAAGYLENDVSGDRLQLWHKRQNFIWSDVDVRLSETLAGQLIQEEETPLRSQNPYYAEYHLPAGTEALGIRWDTPDWAKADVSGQIVLTLVDNGAV